MCVCLIDCFEVELMNEVSSSLLLLFIALHYCEQQLLSYSTHAQRIRSGNVSWLKTRMLHTSNGLSIFPDNGRSERKVLRCLSGDGKSTVQIDILIAGSPIKSTRSPARNGISVVKIFPWQSDNCQ